MANFKEVFKNEHAILPVIHVETLKQALENARIAQGEGADGVFLISMQGMGHSLLLNIHRGVRKQLPGLWMGINFLGVQPAYTFDYGENIEGIWVDNAGINESSEGQDIPISIAHKRRVRGWEGLYFGGVAFKYQAPVLDLGRVAKIATQFVDVVTTSGDGTGLPPSVEKIKVMKQAMGNHPLAIASGISSGNIVNYLPYTDAFLVATSLLKPGTEYFDPQKMEALIRASR